MRFVEDGFLTVFKLIVTFEPAVPVDLNDNVTDANYPFIEQASEVYKVSEPVQEKELAVGVNSDGIVMYKTLLAAKGVGTLKDNETYVYAPT